MSDLRARMMLRSGTHQFVVWWRDHLISTKEREMRRGSNHADWHDDMLDAFPNDEELEQLYARFLVEKEE